MHMPSGSEGQQMQRLDARHQRHRQQSNLTRCSARNTHSRSRVVEIEIETASCVPMLLVCHMLDWRHMCKMLMRATHTCMCGRGLMGVTDGVIHM